jgi:hypothetical protein
MIGEDDCGAIGGMKIGMGNRSTRRKPAPAPLCPPQMPLDQTRDRTRAAAVGSQLWRGLDQPVSAGYCENLAKPTDALSRIQSFVMLKEMVLPTEDVQ